MQPYLPRLRAASCRLQAYRRCSRVGGMDGEQGTEGPENNLGQGEGKG